MNDYDYSFTYRHLDAIDIIIHFQFSTDIELLKTWETGDTQYYMRLELEDVTGEIYNQSTSDTTYFEGGNASIQLEAVASNDATVYGVYFREFDPDPDNLAFSWRVGVNPDTDVQAGFGPISEDCNLDINSFVYSDNSYNFQTSGGYISGQFNETQGWASWYMFVEQILTLLDYNDSYAQGLRGNLELTINVATNIPIWDTFDHCHRYKTSGQTVANGLLNGYEAPSEDSFGRYYINNLVSNNGNITNIRDNNYYKFDGVTNCLGFASEDGVHATLYEFKGGPSIIYKSEDKGVSYDTVNSYPHSYICSSDLTIPAYVLSFKTNIPFFKGDANDSGYDKLRSYVTGQESSSGRRYTADDAVNRSFIDDADIMGKIGDVVNQTTNGTSTIAWTYGIQMFDLTETQKNNFLRNILSQARVNDLLDNTKLFGSNQIGALQSLRYFPIDVSEVCTEGSAPSCQIGSYTYNFSSSVNQILQNNKIINMGEQFFRSPYENGDFRNFEPWCKLYVLLPYAGIHELVISRYINKRVGIKLAVDVTTGACEYHLYASGLEMDSFQGQMGSQIPLTANDKASQVSAVQNGILTSVSGLAQSASDVQQTIGAAGSMITGGMDTGKALTSGGPFTPGINALNSGVTIAQGAQTAIRNFLNAPIQTKGASAGNLGDFGVNSPYFIFAWANSIAPANELNLVGKPSNQGGKVGQFAGYLKCSAFRLANGFTGTAAEAAQIAAQMMEGVYI